MARRPVTHTRKSPRGDIVALAFPGADWSPRVARDAIRDLENRRHTYFVPWQDREIDIHVVDHPQGKYLRTDWDTTTRNNLGDLPEPDEFEPGDRAAITTWTRLEPRCRHNDLQPGLSACLYDPLWLLARQWQFGEFELSDGGSPAAVRLQAAYTSPSRYSPGSAPEASQPYDSNALPLETLVEREPTSPPHMGLRSAVEAGLHFLRLLRAFGVAPLQATYLEQYPFPAPAGGEHPLDPDSARFLLVMSGRTPDGRALYRDLDTAVRGSGDTGPGLPATPAIPEGDRDAVLRAAAAWLTWCDTLAAAPGSAPSSWVPDRMEHAFTISARAPHADAELALDATEHSGGHLDWYAFDARVSALQPDDAPSPHRVDATTVPTSVVFPGMPAVRWWEFEDARVNLASIETPREDLAHMLVLEFALAFGNDWFVVPLRLPVGALCRIGSLIVTDTFGHETEIEPAHRLDPRWRLFSLSGLESADDVLFLPPSLVASLDGPPLEEVVLLRDEMANLAWAVERVVQSPTGRPLDRSESFARSRPGDGPPAEGADLPPDVDVAYRLASRVPDHWIPLVPTQVERRGVRLRRGAMLGRDGLGPVEPRGQLLRPDETLLLYEEEVPRAGVEVVRAYQYARWIDGSTHLWRSRTKRSGRGEGSSGLQYDSLEPL